MIRIHPLVIDPVMKYGIYLAGIGVADARAITKDPDGNAYVAGRTYTGFTLLVRVKQSKKQEQMQLL